MRILSRLYWGAVASFFMAAASAQHPRTDDSAQLQAGKVRVIAALRQEQASTEAWVPRAQARGLELFLETIEQTPAEQLPPLLVETFLSCPARCPNGLESHVAEKLIEVSGTPALQLLLDRFQQLDAFKKETTLYISLRVTPLQCPTPLLDEALSDPVFRVRAAAIRVYRKNCAEDLFYARLDRSLARETKPEFLLYLLDEVPANSAKSEWAYNRLIQLVQDKRIPAADALQKLCVAPTDARVRIANVDTRLWLDVFDAHPQQRRCLIPGFFLKLESEAQLVQVRRLFRAAADRHYGFNASVQGAWDTVRLGGNDPLDDATLALFQARLSRTTMQRWLRESTAPLGEKMLLARWLGQSPAALLPGSLRLRIEVRSESGALVSSTAQLVPLDRPFAFTVAPLSAGFQTIPYRGKLRFDAEALRYRLDDFVVGLQPAGAGFEALIPLSGKFLIKMTVDGRSFEWKIFVDSEGL